MPRRPRQPPRSSDAPMQFQLGAIFIRRAERAGLDLDALNKRFDLPRTPEAWRGSKIPNSVFCELSEALAEELHDPFLGLHAALEFERGAYGLVEFLCRNCAT